VTHLRPPIMTGVSASVDLVIDPLKWVIDAKRADLCDLYGHYWKKCSKTTRYRTACRGHGEVVIDGVLVVTNEPSRTVREVGAGIVDDLPPLRSCATDAWHRRGPSSRGG
jgi:hypothetical protein